MSNEFKETDSKMVYMAAVELFKRHMQHRTTFRRCQVDEGLEGEEKKNTNKKKKRQRKKK